MTSQYLGTTAPSSTTNPPIELVNSLGGQANRQNPGSASWYYNSSNSSTELTTAGFFTDAQALGMKAGDIVFCVYNTSAGSTTPIPYMGCIGIASSTGATLHTLTS